MSKIMEFSLDPKQYESLTKVIKLEMQISERQRACEIIQKYIVPPDNDGYWANDLLKDIMKQIRRE